MNAQTNITAAPVVQNIEFSNLYVDDINPRTVVDDEAIARLAANIKKVGLIQNLAGYCQDGRDRIGIVAGGRRLRALALLQDDPRFQIIPVNVTTDPDVAQQWASSENAQRVDLSPAEEIRHYGKLAHDNVEVSDIAVAYGVTEKHVYRRLALSNLPEPILDALQAEEISLGHASAFTVGNDEALALEVLEQVKESVARGYSVMSEYHIKQALRPNVVKGSDRRIGFVGLDAYKEAGGQIGHDLFDDDALLDNPEILDALFAAKLTLAGEERAKAEGWKWSEICLDTYIPYQVMQDGNFGRVYRIEGEWTEDQATRYDELAELAEADALDDAGRDEMDALDAIIEGDYAADHKAHAGFIIYVGRNGEVETTTGLIRQEDRAEAEQAGVIEPSKHKPVETVAKSPISDKLRMNLGRVSTGARQDALLDDPQLALHLFAFQLCGKMGYRSAFGFRKDEVPNMPETETGYELDKRLTTPEKQPEDPFDSDLVKEFQTFRRRGDKKIMEVLNRFLVSQLSVGDEDLGAFIDKATKRNTRDNWTPTAENFFGKVGGPYLVFLWADLLGLAADHPTVTTFAKLKKREKADKLESLFADPATRKALGLTDDQEAHIAAWLPEGMI